MNKYFHSIFYAILSVDRVAFSFEPCSPEVFMEFKSYIMDSIAVNRALARISHEIVERNGGCDEICIVGIMRRGASLADILAAKVRTLGIEVNTGYLDITRYRDDLGENETKAEINKSEFDFSVTGKTVIMVDDVVYTGRTARAAMEAIIAMGRPAKIQFAALIDRGHRELPIVADYIGKNVPTSRSETIVVSVPPFDSEVSVSIWNK